MTGMDLHQLWPLIAIVLVVLALATLAKFLKAPSSGTPAYEKNGPLFSPAERSFLGVLEQVFASDYWIIGKVRLADVIKPRKGLSSSARVSAQNRINSKHVDFVLCDPRSREVVAVVELNDASHERTSRKERDAFVVGALKAAGIPFAQIPAQKSYAPEEVRRQILGAITPSA